MERFERLPLSLATASGLKLPVRSKGKESNMSSSWDDHYNYFNRFIMDIRIFAAAEAPIEWDPVDVAPVRYPDGTMGIPKAVIESVNKNKVGLKSPLMTPVGKGFRSLNLALRKGEQLSTTSGFGKTSGFH